MLHVYVHRAQAGFRSYSDSVSQCGMSNVHLNSRGSPCHPLFNSQKIPCSSAAVFTNKTLHRVCEYHTIKKRMFN